jgi:hypothetical protein
LGRPNLAAGQRRHFAGASIAACRERAKAAGSEGSIVREAVPIAGSACAFHRPAARSVWPRTNDLGALDLSARSGADRVYDAGADRQIWRVLQARSAHRQS